MKAKEYFKKHEDNLRKDAETNSNNTAIAILMEMSEEVKDICEKRNARWDSAVVAVLREQSDKWNALVRICEANGIHYLIPNGFKQFWINKMPALASDWQERKILQERSISISAPAEVELICSKTERSK